MNLQLPPVSQTSQLVAMSQAGPSLLPPSQPQMISPGFVLNQQQQQPMILHNGQLMTLAQPQGMIYQQLPDGTLLQVQNQLPVLQPPQPIMINNPGAAGHQIINNHTPQYIMTPQGLMQTVSPVQTQQAAVMSSPTQPKRAKRTGSGKKKPRRVRPKTPTAAEEVDEQDGAENVSAEDTDTSYEEPLPSTSKLVSPRSSIQSNKVDSSGLNATPPHQDTDKSTADRAFEFEQLRSKGLAEEARFEFDSSLDESRVQEDKGSEEEEDGEGEEEDGEEEEGEEEEGEEEQKLVSSSVKKKRKRNADDIVKEQIHFEGKERFF